MFTQSDTLQRTAHTLHFFSAFICNRDFQRVCLLDGRPTQCFGSGAVGDSGVQEHCRVGGVLAVLSHLRLRDSFDPEPPMIPHVLRIGFRPFVSSLRVRAQFCGHVGVYLSTKSLFVGPPVQFGASWGAGSHEALASHALRFVSVISGVTLAPFALGVRL